MRIKLTIFSALALLSGNVAIADPVTGLIPFAAGGQARANEVNNESIMGHTLFPYGGNP